MTTILEQAIQHKNIKNIKELLDDGILININSIEEYKDDILSKTIRQIHSIEIIELLLEYGANPIFINSDGRTALSEAIAINRVDIASLLLKYGAISNISSIVHPYTLFSIQNQALIHSEIAMLELFLDNGIDRWIEQDIDDLIRDANDLGEYVWLNEYDFNKIVYLKQNRKIIENILFSKSPPYLKLEKNNYIIYENREVNEDISIYLLADKQKYKNKKYLYADNKIDTFVYWCYKKELLHEGVIKSIKNYENKLGELNHKNIHRLVISTLGNKVTTEFFSAEGKAFSIAYLTVTNWWYNLHIDFNRLYQKKDNRLPLAIQSQEAFDTLMRLLDIRHEQYKSGKDFNSNQNKAELGALIEGIEPPKRVVNLSFLVELTADRKNNILPEDFLNKN